MPKNTTVRVEAGWELLTDEDVTDITFQNIGISAVYIIGTSGNVDPVEDFGILYKSGEGEAKKALAELFPGVTGVNRLWAKSASTNAQVFVSHA